MAISQLSDDELRNELYQRTREKLGYPVVAPESDDDKLKWIKLRRDRLEREHEQYLAIEREAHAKGESVNSLVTRGYHETIQHMGHYMLDDLNFLLTALKGSA